MIVIAGGYGFFCLRRMNAIDKNRNVYSVEPLELALDRIIEQ